MEREEPLHPGNRTESLRAQHVRSRFLEKYYIAHAKIKKISSTRKVTLASYGIETAADVVRHRIESIAGFGPSLASHLIAWRKSIEQRFVFDPNERLNPADVNSVRSEISRLQADLEGRIRRSVATLQHVANEVLEQRNRLKTGVNAAFRALKQAQLDEQTATKPIEINIAHIKKAAVLVGVLAVVAYIGWQNAGSSVPAPRPPSSPSAENRSAPSSPPPNSQPLPKPKVEPRTSSPTEPPSTSPPLDSTPTPADESAAKVEDNSRIVLTDLTNNKDEARRVQQRLIKLGYLDVADGIWGPRSRRALQEFRTAMAIGNDSSWDERTQQELFSESAKRSPTTPQISPQNPSVAVQQPGPCWIPTNDDLGFGYWGDCSDKRSRAVK